MTSTNKLLKAQIEDEKRSKKIDDILQNIALLDLDHDSDDLLQKSIEESQEVDSGLEQYAIKGKKFISYNSDKLDLVISSVTAPDISYNDKEHLHILLINGKLQKMLNGGSLVGYENEITVYIFRILFCNLSDEDLRICQKCLFCSVDRLIKQTINDTIISTCEEMLDLLGGKSYTTRPQTQNKTFNVDKNFIYVLKSINYILKKYIHFKSIVDSVILNSLLSVYMKISMDSSILESDVSQYLFFEISNAIQLILELYYDDEFIEVHMLNIVESFGEYLDSFSGDFPHQAIRHICCNIIPCNKLGILFKQSIAFYGLMCCLSNDNAYLYNHITTVKFANMLNQNMNVFEARSFRELYSMIYLIDACIPRAMKNCHELASLERIIKMVSSVIGSRSHSENDIGPKLLMGLYRNVKNNWEKLREAAKKRTLEAESSSETEIDIY